MRRSVSRGLVALALGGTLASVGTAVPAAHADTLADAKARATQLRHQVDDLQQQAEIATEKYDETEAALGVAVNANLTAQQDLQVAQAASGASDSATDRRARALYINGGNLGIYVSVLQTGSIAEAQRRLHQVQVVLGDDATSLRNADNAVARQTAAAARLAKTADAKVQLQTAAANQADRVRTLLSDTTNLLGSADAQVRAIADQQARAAAAAAAAAAATQLAQAEANVGALPNVPASPLAAAALRFAQSQLGKPYQWGATGPATFDCSGLTGAAYAAAGLVLPRTSREQWFSGPHVQLGQLEPGDLLFWAHDVNDPSTIHHVALYAGDGLMVAAPHTGDVVRVQPIYLDGYIGAVRPGAPQA